MPIARCFEPSRVVAAGKRRLTLASGIIPLPFERPKHPFIGHMTECIAQCFG
jgi:hypothetical protein